MSNPIDAEDPRQFFQRQDEGEPVFREPWEAQAFALVLRLHEQGYFSWQEWAQALSREIAAASENDDTGLELCASTANRPDSGELYYRYWLQALESLILEKDLATVVELDSRQQAWKQAHHNTPHGEPVDLANAVSEQILHADKHDH